MSKTNIYEDILANIDSEKRAWCKRSWDVRENGELGVGNEALDDGYGDSKVISRCLVSHIDLALGTSYVKPNGKRFVSKDVKKWRRRERVLATLYSLLPKKVQEELKVEAYDEERGYYETAPAPRAITKGDVEALGPFADRIHSQLAGALVSFNDEFATKAKVRNLLKRAAKQHSED